MKYALLGKPLTHSFSPLLHRYFAKQTGLLLDYTLIECASHELSKAISSFRVRGGKGFNITAPLKQEVCAHADVLSDSVRRIGAANLAYWQEDKLILENCDGVAWWRDLQKKKISLSQKSVCVLGAGGAAYAILDCLCHASPKELFLVNRHAEKLDKLRAQFNLPCPTQCLALSNLVHIQPDVIIQATSTNDFNFITKHTVGKQTICYDLQYSQMTTPFLARMQGLGARQLYDGFGMLVEQAAISFQRWTGSLAPTITRYEQLGM